MFAILELSHLPTNISLTLILFDHYDVVYRLSDLKDELLPWIIWKIDSLCSQQSFK